MKIRIGSRDSLLAVTQSNLVLHAMEQACPDAQITLVCMKTTGDKILDKTLDQIGGKGLFVKELDLALREDRADFTVHSLKDMPMEVPEDLPLVAFSRREDPRDVLILPENVQQLDTSRPIGCSSRRRQLQLQAIYPDMEVKSVRGNLQTRLKKLESGEFSALVLAAAGIKRLGLTHRIHRYFSPEEMLPAAGQGILAVQSRKGVNCDCLKFVRDEEATACALAERAFVRELNGGCTSPVAAYATVTGELLTLTGLYVSPDETIIRKGQATAPCAQAETLGRDLAMALRGGTI